MNQITSSSAIYEQQSISTQSTTYPFFYKAMIYGVIAGGLIALCLFILQALGMENVIGWKYAAYGALGIVLAFAIKDYDRFLKTGTTFKNGMTFAAQISLIAGATLIAVNTFNFLIGSDLVFAKYGLETADFPSLMLLNGAIFLEVMVSGLVFTLMVLQYFKSRRDYSE